MSARGWTGRRLHFVGIGGAGMSGLALIADELGAAVTGSDRASSPYLERVAAAGIAAVVGHDAANVPAGRRRRARRLDGDRRGEPRARRRPRARAGEIHRGALLGELSRLRRTISIAGTHGKTTTASMAAHALLALGWDPTYVIGGELRRPGETRPRDERRLRHRRVARRRGRRVGPLVPRADLRDRRGHEHRARPPHDVSVAARPRARVRATSCATGCAASSPTRPDAEAFLDRVGIVESAFFGASEIALGEDGSRFVWAGQPVALSVPGVHNVANAAAALTACVIAGARPREVAGTLADFAGAGRRFERLGHHASGALVVDDYAHHPTELRATIAAARTLGHRRVVAVFQPHLFSRTQMLCREFGAALAQADAAVVLDIYPSRERAEDFPGVTGRLVAEAAADAARGRPVAWAPDFDAAQQVLEATL